MSTKTNITEDTRILVLHETRWQSVFNDIITFGCVYALAWANHTYLSGSWVLDGFAVFAALTTAFKVKSDTTAYCTVEELRRWASQ